MLVSKGINSLADDSLIESVRQAFENAGFDEARVLSALNSPSFPTYRERRRGLAHFLRLIDDDSKLHTLIRAFVLGESVPLDRFSEAARPANVDDWKGVGLVSIDQDAVWATTEICPVGSLLFAADWSREQAAADSVMSPSASTRALFQMMIRRRAGQALDLGTGCGILALSASGYSEKVFATDINERALKFALFNAKFNRIENVRFACGPMFQPAQDQTFDHILCNPPFLIGPKTRFLHSSTDLGSDQFSEQIVRRAPSFLNEGGFFQTVSNWAELEGDGQTGRDRVMRWFEGSGCDVWVLHSHTETSAEYARARSREVFENEEEANSFYKEWMEYFDREKIEGIHFGVITMRRRSGNANWVRFEQLPAVSGQLGESLEQGFTMRDFLDDHSSDEEFLDTCLKCVSDLEVNWNKQGKMAAVSLATGLKFSVNLDRAIVKFVRSCNGNIPLCEQLRKIAAGSGESMSQFAPKFVAVTRRLVELGFLLPGGEP